MVPVRIRILLWSALSGVLWALSWPAIGGLAPLAFVAWLPLFHAERLHAERVVSRQRSFVPYVWPALIIWNLVCTSWLGMVSEPTITRLVSGGVPTLVNTALMSLPWWFKRIVQRRWGGPVSAWAFIVFWIALERIHHDWDLQWPWLSIGNVFGAFPAWVQWYEFTGMLGGSLWVLVIAVLLDRMFVAMRQASFRSVMAVPVLVIALLPLAWSLWRYAVHTEEGPGVEVVVVQPNVDPYREKFGGVEPMAQLDRMLALADTALTPSTRLVVFPETALQENATVDLGHEPPRTQGLWENDLEASRSVMRMRAFQREHPQVALLSGMSSAYLLRTDEPRRSTARPLGDDRHWYEAYNAALFIGLSGDALAYHKSKLVAGVELMPFEEVLGPLSDLALDLGGTTGSLGAQEDRAIFEEPSSGLRIAPAICYESVFGEHLAAHIRNGANLIAIMTNDGWWGPSAGYRQHLTFASLRAIEMRRAIARSANTGISCFVDQRGAVLQATDWWVPDVRRSVVHLNDRLTFFARHGDLVGRCATWIALLLLLFLATWRWWRRS